MVAKEPCHMLGTGEVPMFEKHSGNMSGMVVTTLLCRAFVIGLACREVCVSV